MQQLTEETYCWWNKVQRKNSNYQWAEIIIDSWSCWRDIQEDFHPICHRIFSLSNRLWLHQSRLLFRIQFPELISSYDWCSAVLDKLTHSIQFYQKSMTTTSTTTLGGCILALVVCIPISITLVFSFFPFLLLFSHLYILLCYHIFSSMD